MVSGGADVLCSCVLGNSSVEAFVSSNGDVLASSVLGSSFVEDLVYTFVSEKSWRSCGKSTLSYPSTMFSKSFAVVSSDLEPVSSFPIPFPALLTYQISQSFPHLSQ